MEALNELELLKQQKVMVAEAKAEQQKWLPLWRDLNEAFFPFIYSGLSGAAGNSNDDKVPRRNTKLLDGASAQALYTLAAGYMNGVTSPARKWLNVKRPGSKPYTDPDAGESLRHSEIRSKLLEVLAGSNYYEMRAVEVYDGCGLGTSGMLIYEDYETVIRCVTLQPGTFYLITNEYNEVVGMARQYKLRAHELLSNFGADSLGPELARKAASGGPESRRQYEVTHLLEVNANDGLMPSRTKYRELYWLNGQVAGAPPYLAKRPMHEWPLSIFRWACPDNVPYGVPPTMTVLGKAIQLQTMEYKTDQGFDKMVSPPLLADMSLKNRPKAFQANGITFTSNLSPNTGARPLMQVNIPIQELMMRRQQTVESIEEGLFNPLFNMISQLDTVRSATEIDARKEEKLVMLGPVLQRGYTEDLSVVVQRVYGICVRKGIIEPIEDEQSSIEFSNVLSDVQKASDVSTIERFFGFVGQIIPAFPEIQPSVDAPDLLRQYAEGLGIRPSTLKRPEVVDEANAQNSEMQQLAQVSEVAKNFASAGQSAGSIDVGGGMNAVQALLGG